MTIQEALTTNISTTILAGAAAGQSLAPLFHLHTAISTGLFTSTTTLATAACADGDCTNEASATSRF